MEKIIEKILKNNNINFNNLKKSSVGFTNLVYFIDDLYVIKISKDEKTKQKLQKEINIYKNLNFKFIPKLVAYGEYEDLQYLIITKIKGNSLYSIWHTLSKDERRNCVSQIVNILKAFHNYTPTFLTNYKENFNWIEHIKFELNNRINELKALNYETEFLHNFIENEVTELFKDNKFGLVYNDAHFDNFIYDNGNLSLIDFDRVECFPIDYEMLIFKTMCDNPSKFASEEDEDKIKDEDYIGIYEQFKQEYPEMFEIKNVEKRIYIYQFNYLLKQANKCKNTEWIEELLNEFKNIIGMFVFITTTFKEIFLD